jgi:hypothetical protein
VAPGAYAALLPEPYEPFRWVSRRTLWRSRRDTVARVLGDPSLRARPRLVPAPPAAIDRTDLDEPSIAVLGDTGEGDASQYAVVPVLHRVAGDTDLMVIASDVVYPAGGRGEYAAKFFRPYRDYRKPILAVPGNHDWYDGLDGFHWCFVRGEGERPAAQPAPYWALDTGPLRIVGIDTGILGRLDGAQLAWLRRAAAERDVPKVLVTGTPLVAGAAMRSGDPVLAIVNDPAHRFVAVLAGDVHNYQRSAVRLPDGRVVHHVVCGGGGAYTNATHTIPRVDLPGCAEDDVRLYPLRGDSLSWFASRFEAWARTRKGIPPSDIDPDVAAALMGERLGLAPVRASARAATPRDADRAAALRVFPARGMRGVNRFADQYYDTDDPPFFKHLLRLDATATELRLRCFAATGRPEDEDDPPVEDDVRIALA